MLAGAAGFLPDPPRRSTFAPLFLPLRLPRFKKGCISVGFSEKGSHNHAQSSLKFRYLTMIETAHLSNIITEEPAAQNFLVWP